MAELAPWVQLGMFGLAALALYAGMLGRYIWKREADARDSMWRERYDEAVQREAMWRELALHGFRSADKALTVAQDVTSASAKRAT